MPSNYEFDPAERPMHEKLDERLRDKPDPNPAGPNRPRGPVPDKGVPPPAEDETGKDQHA